MSIDEDERERELVRAFFGGATGFFVEVGANDPQRGSQTWHLEQRGWRGVLVEPQPELAARARQTRKAQVFAVACSSQGGRRPFHVAGTMSSLDRATMAPGTQPECTIEIEVRTLDDILADANAPQPIDFVSLDVEGHELEVLRGFDLARWRPRLILMEDHVSDLSKHRYLSSAGYRAMRRTGFNGWYVPADLAARASLTDRWGVLRKYYLALPLRILRNWSRALRQPAKDRKRI
jgi:FkbM family methyltransferase